ncbi:hypothetical protein Hanom_Chr10g00910131 [Helianthus anomalus]
MHVTIHTYRISGGRDANHNPFNHLHIKTKPNQNTSEKLPIHSIISLLNINFERTPRRTHIPMIIMHELLG